VIQLYTLFQVLVKIIVKITFDSLFWDNVVSKIGSNYFQYILPTLSRNWKRIDSCITMQTDQDIYM
jgi:hypothetical protein